MSNASKERENTQIKCSFSLFFVFTKGGGICRKSAFSITFVILNSLIIFKKFKNNREGKSVEKHFYDIKNELAYFKTVVKNMDLDDIKREKNILIMIFIMKNF